MKTKHLLFVILAGSLIFASCTRYPGAADRLDEDLVVFTQYDTNADFSVYSTYAIPDSITVVTETDSGRIKTTDSQILIDQIVKNMNARGYTRVTSGQTPDLGINVAVFKNTTVTVYYPGWYWGYPGYYPPDYYGGWYGYDYWYPYYPVVTTYSTGTVQIEMVDLKIVDPVNERIFIRWSAYVRALLTGYHTESEVQWSIDQAFAQTPQLTK